MDQVLPLRIVTSYGVLELFTAVAISPNYAVTLCIFSPDDSVTVETSSGIPYPDSIIVSPDMGMVKMTFYEEIFDSYQISSDVIPDIGEILTIIGHRLAGVIAVEGRAREQCPDGSFLLTSDPRDGFMGAAVFSFNEEYVGIITGIIRPDRQFRKPTTGIVLFFIQVRSGTCGQNRCSVRRIH